MKSTVAQRARQPQTQHLNCRRVATDANTQDVSGGHKKVTDDPVSTLAVARQRKLVTLRGDDETELRSDLGEVAQP